MKIESLTLRELERYASTRGYIIHQDYWRGIFTLKCPKRPDLFCWLYHPSHPGQPLRFIKELDTTEWENVIDKFADWLDDARDKGK